MSMKSVLTAATSAAALSLAAFSAQATEEIKGGGGAGMAAMATPSAVSQAMHDKAGADNANFLQTNGNYWQSRFHPAGQINSRNVTRHARRLDVPDRRHAIRSRPRRSSSTA